MIIDGYQGYKINVGNNFLEYLLVRNCPNLTTLRYAHNAMLHDAWYEPQEFNNPNLTIIDKYKYDDPSINTEFLELFEKGELKEGEKFNQQLDWKKTELEKKKIINEKVKNLLTKVQNQANIPLQDFLDIFGRQSPQSVFDSLEPEVKEQFSKELVHRLEPKVLELVSKNLTPERLVAELEPYKNFLYLLSAETRAKLTRLMAATTNDTLTPQPKIWPWMLGSIIIFPLVLAIFYWLTKRWVRWDLRKLVKSER